MLGVEICDIGPCKFDSVGLVAKPIMTAVIAEKRKDCVGLYVNSNGIFYNASAHANAGSISGVSTDQ